MKTETISLRVDPEIKKLLLYISKTERRSITSMIEILIAKYYADYYKED